MLSRTPHLETDSVQILNLQNLQIWWLACPLCCLSNFHGFTALSSSSVVSLLANMLQGTSESSCWYFRFPSSDGAGVTGYRHMWELLSSSTVRTHWPLGRISSVIGTALEGQTAWPAWSAGVQDRGVDEEERHHAAMYEGHVCIPTKLWPSPFKLEFGISVLPFI